MEDTIKHLVERIEHSALPQTEKDDIYAAISEALHRAVLPILIEHMPKDQLKELADNPAKVTIESYSALILKAVEDGAAFSEIENAMKGILSEVDTVLKEDHI